MRAWFTYSTPDAAKNHVLQTNTSIGDVTTHSSTHCR